MYILTLGALMNSFLSVIFFIVLISGCSTTKNEVLATPPQLIKQCFLTTHYQIKMTQDYLEGERYSALYAKYAEKCPNTQIQDFLTSEIKHILAKDPKDAFDYGAYRYSSCVKDNGHIVKEENVKTCLRILVPSELAIKLKHLGKSKHEALNIMTVQFPEENTMYKFSKKSIDKWYSETSQSPSNFLYSEFNHCMKLTKSRVAKT